MKSVRFLVALSSILGALSGEAFGYVFDTDNGGHPLHWTGADMAVPYWLVSNNAPGGAAGEAAVQRAFQTWSAVSPNLAYRFAGNVNGGTHQYDHRNIVYWVYGNWSYDPTLMAITLRYFDNRDGHMLDADILVNAQSYAWSVGGPGFDVENTITHEVGHFGGLGHSADPQATMFATARPGETAKRTLAGDDVAALNALYGGGPAAGTGSVTAPPVSGGGGGGGGCSIGSGPRNGGLGDFVWIGGVLGGLLLRRKMRRRKGRCARGGAAKPETFSRRWSRGGLPRPW